MQDKMATQPRERKLVTVEPKGPSEIERPVWPPTERAKAALRELREGQLLQLVWSRPRPRAQTLHD